MFLFTCWEILQIITNKQTKVLTILPSLKKQRAKGVPDSFPTPLKAGSNTFPASSGPGTHSTHHRARMVYSSPCADVADWSMP